MRGIELREKLPCSIELFDRYDESVEHPRFGPTHIAGLVSQRRFERQAARREHSRIINRLTQKSAKRSRNTHHREELTTNEHEWTRRFSAKLLIVCRRIRWAPTSSMLAGSYLSASGCSLHYRPSQRFIAQARRIGCANGSCWWPYRFS